MRFRLTGSILLALALTACATSTSIDTTRWTGQLQSVLPSPVSARVAGVSQAGRTRFTIDMSNGEPGVTYGWRVDSGTCDAQGSILGGTASYETLTASEAGSASGEASVPGMLTPGSDYAARVYQADGSGQTVLACGMIRQE